MNKFWYFLNAVCEIAMLAFACYLIIVGAPAEASLCVSISIVNSRQKDKYDWQ